MLDISVKSFDILRSLNFSTHRFYLSGSRYFGYARPDSDWDFVSDMKSMDYLISKNFIRVKMNPNWLDINTAVIYQLEDIQVAIQLNLKLRLKAQEILKNNAEMPLMNVEKFNRNLIWDEVYSRISDDSTYII